MRDDRKIHARGPGIEVVRYDRAGKWYVEIAANFGRYGLAVDRMPLTLDDAVDQALALEKRGGGEILFGQPGGRAFDRRVLLQRQKGTT